MATISKIQVRKWPINFILWTLIMFGTTIPIVSYIAVGITAIMIMRDDNRYTIPILFAIEPFANVFKASPNSQSFFTMLVFLYVCWNIIRKKNNYRTELFTAMYGMYLVVIQLACNTLDIERTLKFVVNLFFLQYALVNSQKIDYKDIFLSYIGGIIVSSFVKLSGVFTNINSYVDTVAVGQYSFDDIIRFAGLYNDPNYYAVNVIIAMCLVIVMFHCKKMSTLYATVTLSILVLFVGLTSSKSALFMLALPMILLLYSNSKNRRHFIQLVFIVVVIIGAVLIIAGRITIFDIVFERLSQADDIESLTTGRSRIWKEYLSYFAEHAELLIFGRGLGAGLINRSASHNTYIDILYYLGIVGGALMLGMLGSIAKQREGNNDKCFLNSSVALCITIMYAFLGQLFYFDLIFQLYLAIVVWKMPLKRTGEVYE